eukprot:12421726-Karenia_brevis.AAC.1
MDANIDQIFVCNLNGFLVGSRANIASKRPPTWRGGTRLQVFGLGGILEALAGLLEVSRAQQGFKA